MKLRPARSALVLAALVGLAGCSANADPAPADPAPAASSPGAPAQEGPEEGAGEDDLALIDRLTPVARVKGATDIRVEGTAAWVTVTNASSDAMALLDCLHLLPAIVEGEETLTVIFADGVEEECAWPEE